MKSYVVVAQNKPVDESKILFSVCVCLDGSREHHDVIQEEYGVWCGGIWNRCATQVTDCAPKHLLLVCV